MYKTINSDLLLDSNFQRLSVGAKSLYITLFCQSDGYGFVNNVFRTIGVNSYVATNLDDLVKAGYVIMINDDTALIADFFLHSGFAYASLNENRMDDYDGVTIIDGRFVKLSVANKPKRRASFTPPTLDEVKAYALERGTGVDPVAFYTYYTTPNENGETWVNSAGKPVSNWKGTFCSVWERNRRMKGAANGRGNQRYSQNGAAGNPQGVSKRFDIKATVDGRGEG